MGKTLKTKYVTSKSHTSAVEQEFWLPIQWPLASDRMILQAFDEDRLSNEQIGSMFFSLKKLLEQGKTENGHFYWQNIYGGPAGYNNSASQIMNDNPELASAWKGRLLMQIESEDCKHPERREQALEETIKQRAIDAGMFMQQEYEIIAEVGMGICLPTSNKYTVKIKIGDIEIESSSPKECKGSGYNRWSERFNMQKF